MKNGKTPLILRPFFVCLLLVSALTVCSLAFRAAERAEVNEPVREQSAARSQESMAYYKGLISTDKPIDLPPLPEVPQQVAAYQENGLPAIPDDIAIPRSLSENIATAPVVAMAGTPQWRQNAAAFAPEYNKGKIVIIIDDMGMDKRRSAEALTLPGPLTLSYLPYATHLQPSVDEARQKGHEVLVHIPMEPESTSIDAGPTVLRASMTDDEMRAMMDKNLSAFSGYTGFNNHMGSKLTQDQQAMQIVMAEAVKRGLLVVDSRTSAVSVADQVAEAFGAAHTVRDVFLDHHEDLNSVKDALAQLENVARHKGYAVAIGHPKDNTLAALREWLPTLAGKGLQLAPVSAVVRTSEPSAGGAGYTAIVSGISSPFVVGPLQPPE